MTMKGKEKKLEGRVTRSKSPARGQSPAREPPSPPSKTSTPTSKPRGRSRSRSPARTPGKAGSIKSETSVRSNRKSEPVPKSKPEPEVKSKAISVNQTSVKTSSRRTEIVTEEKLTRSSHKASLSSETPTVLLQRKRETTSEQTKVDTVDSTAVKSPAQQQCCVFAPLVCMICFVGLLLLLTAVVTTVAVGCNFAKCNVTQLPDLPVGVASYFDVQAVLIVLGWVVLQLLLACLPIGWTRTGGMLADGTRIHYRCNGLSSLLLTSVLFGALYYLKQPVFKTTSTLFIPMLVSFTGLAFIFSLFTFIRSRRNLSDSARTGVVGFLYGRDVLPCIGPLNVKIFCIIHMAVLGWAALNGITVHQAYMTSKLNTAFIAVAAMQFVFIFDFILFQASLSNSLLITHDPAGFLFMFLTLVWVPFTHSALLRYLLHNQQTISHPILAAVILLFGIGCITARRANFTKDKFRQRPNAALSMRPYQIIPSASGKYLLATGLWALCRHPNYLGCLLMAVAWSLPCGLTSPVTYAYILYMLVLFVSRARRDGAVCEQKHGSIAWTQYCKLVRSRLIPFIY